MYCSSIDSTLLIPYPKLHVKNQTNGYCVIQDGKILPKAWINLVHLLHSMGKVMEGRPTRFVETGTGAVTLHSDAQEEVTAPRKKIKNR